MIEAHEFLREGLVTEGIDKAAAKQFTDSLAQKFIDIDAFHKAYDSELSALGLNNIFVTGTGSDAGLLNSRGTYGAIKNCVDVTVQRALKKLWAAQYSDHLYTKAQKAENDAREAEYQRQQAEAKARREAARQAALDKIKPVAEHIIADALIHVRSMNPDLLTDYKDVSGKDLADDLQLDYDIQLDSQNNFSKAECKISFPGKGRNGIKFCHKFDPNVTPDLDKMAKGIIDLAKDALQEYTDNKLRDDYSTIPAKYNLTDNDYSALYLLDPTTNIIYSYSDARLKRYYVHADRRADSSLVYKTRPNVDNLDLIAASVVTNSSSGRCWSSTSTIKYYKPTAKKFFLVKCGIGFWDVEGGNGETSVTLMPDDKVPEKFKAIGLTKGEYQHYEVDSSD